MPAETYIWWKHGVFYQIYPRSFQDSNQDGIGDLKGIIERLDYLVELGIDAIWVSPIFPSPMADFGYDISDFTDIHPLFGDLQVFKRLLEQAHQRGLRVVLDYVANHSSDEHAWFLESRSSRDNPKRDWYIWRDPKPDGSPPNNWESHFSGGAWEWDENTSQYYLHLFLEKQPDLNWRNPQVVEAMHAALRFWLELGVDGFRMDVVTFLMKHPELPDNPTAYDDQGRPFQEHRYDINQPEVHHVLRDFRKLFDSYPGERVTIGETWFFDPAELAAWYGPALDELQIPFNFITLKRPWQAATMKQAIEAYYAALPPGAQPNFVFGSHDVRRLASRYGLANHRSVGMLLLTLRGTPTLYYGDELGMQDVSIPPERFQDPVMWRKPGTDEGRDPERTPMQWDSSSNAGFCPGDVEPWLPLAVDYPTINVAVERADPHSTFNFYKRLLHLRRTLPALTLGDFQFIPVVDNHLASIQDVLAYRRSWQDQRLLVVINFSANSQLIDLSGVGLGGVTLLSSHFRSVEQFDLARVLVQPHENLLVQLF